MTTNNHTLSIHTYAGMRGEFAQFIVSPNNGHLRLQNVATGHFLAIRQGALTSGVGVCTCHGSHASHDITSPGGQYCEFIVKPHGNDVISLQAVRALACSSRVFTHFTCYPQAYGGGNVGILPNGVYAYMCV